MSARLWRASARRATSARWEAAASATCLGGSKGTLYNYFDSKEELFRAHTLRGCAVQAENIFHGVEHGGDLHECLTELGTRYLAALTSDRTMRSARAVIAEAGRNSEVGEIFYDAGPRVGAERLASIFDRAVADGLLSIGDTQMAAHQFLALCQARVYKCALFNVGGPPSDEDIRRDITAAVSTFMRAYAIA